jgi:hypothetical protein
MATSGKPFDFLSAEPLAVITDSHGRVIRRHVAFAVSAANSCAIKLLILFPLKEIYWVGDAWEPIPKVFAAGLMCHFAAFWSRISDHRTISQNATAPS